MPYKIFGCKVNKFFLNQWLAYYKKTGKNLEKIFLIATCVVTDRAKTKRIREIKHALQQGYEIHITWCGTLHQGKLIEESDFYTFYPALAPYREHITLLGESPLLIKQDQRDFSLSEIPESPLYTKHFIVIQDGCDNYCSFCATVLKRGPHRSRKLEDILQELHAIEAQGGKEIVLTGINLAARGCTNTKEPQTSKFSDLLENILYHTAIPRIRISSIGPEYLDEKFFEVARDTRILPHFHFSIQSFSTSVLQRMKRNYTRETLDHVLTKIRQIKRKDSDFLSLWADIITGFPGETEEEFQETYEALETYGITKLHAFPFSAHLTWESVPAKYYEQQISEEVKKERNKKLIEKGDEIRTAFIQKNSGRQCEVLLEECDNGIRKGRSDNYLPVEIRGDYHQWEIILYTLP